MKPYSRHQTARTKLAIVVGLVGYVAVGYFAIALTYLVAPMPLGGIVVGLALAATLAGAAWVWRGHRERMILLPLVGAIAWLATLALGGACSAGPPELPRPMRAPPVRA